MAQDPEQEDKDAGQAEKGKTGWLATLGRALRDNGALIAALIALVGVIITQIVTTNNTQAGLAAQRKLEEERAREAELQAYFDDMGQMLLDEDNPLSKARSSDPISTLARAKTLAILERSDGLRKGIILQFLHKSQLVRINKPVVELNFANLSGADLSGVELSLADLSAANLSRADLSDANLGNADLSDADLSDADLSDAFLASAHLDRADLSDADLSEANLSWADLDNADLDNADLDNANLGGADLSRADLPYADLSDANLSKADPRDAQSANLSRANLSGADLSDADLSDADLSDADLSDATGVTDEQLDSAWSLEGATMPDGSKHN